MVAHPLFVVNDHLCLALNHLLHCYLFYSLFALYIFQVYVLHIVDKLFKMAMIVAAAVTMALQLTYSTVRNVLLCASQFI